MRLNAAKPAVEAQLAAAEATALASHRATASADVANVDLAPALRDEVIGRLALADPVVAEDVAAADPQRRPHIAVLARSRRNAGLHNLGRRACRIARMGQGSLNRLQRRTVGPRQRRVERARSRPPPCGPMAPAPARAPSRPCLEPAAVGTRLGLWGRTNAPRTAGPTCRTAPAAPEACVGGGTRAPSRLEWTGRTVAVITMCCSAF